MANEITPNAGAKEASAPKENKAKEAKSTPSTPAQSKSDEAGFGSFEEKIVEFQSHLRDLANVQNVDELKDKWELVSTKTRSEVEEHPLQMIALGGMLGFSLGLVSKDVNVRKVSTSVVDWAAKLGAAWAVEKFTDRNKSEASVH